MTTGKEVSLDKFSLKWINSLLCLTFIGPCIANIFPEYNQQDATFHNLFISVRPSTCFRRFFSVHHKELKTAHTVSGICQTKWSDKYLMMMILIFYIFRKFCRIKLKKKALCMKLSTLFLCILYYVYVPSCIAGISPSLNVVAQCLGAFGKSEGLIK